MKSVTKELNEVQKVTAVRTERERIGVDEQGLSLNLSSLVSSLGTAGASPLAVRPAQELSRKESGRNDGALTIRIKLTLSEGSVTVNGRHIPIPIGVSGSMTVKELKKLLKIYAGNTVFIRRRDGLERVRDSQTIELVSGTEFTHRKETPRRPRSSTTSLSSFPTLHRD